MDVLKISENIVRLRHEKKITQDELAEFLGVTKASVSKWETKQSFPDILLLPRLASYFDVTVDELLGYEPQLSREQIRCSYHSLAEDFAKKPFEEVMQESEALVRKYYSCYPFLLQICVLWLNHFMLAKEPARQREILEAIAGLCEHILDGCKEIGICNDAVGIKAMVEIQCGKAQDVIESLEEILNPTHMAEEKGGILVQAYMMSGEMEKAERFTQIDMFKNLLNLVGNGIQLMMIHGQNLEKCENIMARIDSVITAFDMEKIHPNSVANYYYQAAVTYCMHGQEHKAYERLECFVSLIIRMLQEGIVLHGDAFFDKLDSWFEELDLGAQGVRTGKFVMESAVSALENPVFEGLEHKERLHNLKKKLIAEGERL